MTCDASSMAGGTRLAALACQLLVVAASTSAEIRFDLAVQEADFHFRGGERFDYSGSAIAAGDLNNDGVPDLVVGAFLKDGPAGSRFDSGMVTVRFGSPPTAAVEMAGLTIYGARSGDLFGFALAVGDMNGDGVDDLAVSAPGADGPDGGSRTDSGAVYLFFGRDRTTRRFPAVIDLASQTADVTIHGADSDDTSGGAFKFHPLATGLVNGDPYSDLLIGFAGGDGPDGTRESAGEVHLVYGSADLAPVIDLRDASPLVMYGADAGDLMGVAVTIGDMNGDGADDLVGGAKNSAGALNLFEKVGEAVGIFGGDGLPNVIDLGEGPDARDFIVYGIDPLDRSSRAVASGDMNGDDVDDLVIGARHADGSTGLPEQESAGEAYVLFGHPLFSGEYFLEVDASVTVHGAEQNDSVGFSVAVGDMNGDGFGDLITGAQFADGENNTRYKSGEVVVVLGGTTVPPVVDLLVDEPDLRVQGARQRDALGTAIAGVDWDGDGVADLVLGGPGRVYKQLDFPPVEADLERIRAEGGVWVLHGGPVMGVLAANPAVVAPGGSLTLEATLANLEEAERTLRIMVNWIAPGDPIPIVTNLKTKQVSLAARQSVTSARSYPIAPNTAEGDYLVELVIESPPGIHVDRDRIRIKVASGPGP